VAKPNSLTGVSQPLLPLLFANMGQLFTYVISFLNCRKGKTCLTVQCSHCRISCWVAFSFTEC